MPELDPHERAVMPPVPPGTLQRMQPALRAFWEAYASHRRRPEAELGPTLRRATQFAAARLLTAAVEEAQTAPRHARELLNAVHLGHAVLRRPDEAAAQLLGLWTAARRRTATRWSSRCARPR